jgi:hypothetical protein
MKLFKSSLFALLVVMFSLNVTIQAKTEFYVAPEGSDQNPGTIDKPFASLEAARDAIRLLKTRNAFPGDGVTVWIRRGLYPRDKTFELDTQDSGASPDAPVIYSAYKNEIIHFSGGKVLDGWEPVTDKEALNRMPAESRNKVLVVDLKAAGITSYPDFKPYSIWTKRPELINSNGMMLYFKTKPMELARWPNEGFDKIRDIPADSGGEFRGVKVNKKGQFYVDVERAKRWEGEKDLWCRGFFAVQYADANESVKTLDVETGLIELNPPYYYYGYKKSQEGIWNASLYCIANALSELDQPGEYKVDRQAGKIYFWPPAPVKKGDAEIAYLGTPLVKIQNVSNVTFHGFILDGTRSAGVFISGGNGVRFEKCIVRNTGDDAIVIQKGTHHSIIGCDISGSSDGGIRVSGGDRPTLTPCNHLIENCLLYNLSKWDQTYTPAVRAEGVGITVRNCSMHDLPHTAIIFSGNDNIFEYNEIYSVGYATTESGSIYTGRDFSFYGNEIRYNYFHDLYGPDLRHGGAIHLDDAVSGIRVHGNIFQRMSWGISLCGGRDDHNTNNLFLNCVEEGVDAIYRNCTDTNIPTLEKMPYKTPPWSTRFPELLNTLSDMPDYPRGSTIEGNISYGGRFIRWEPAKASLTLLQESIVASNNFDSPGETIEVKRVNGKLSAIIPQTALNVVKGFERLPVEKMGLQPGELRASWPVDQTLRNPPEVWRVYEKNKPTSKVLKAP